MGEPKLEQTTNTEDNQEAVGHPEKMLNIGEDQKKNWSPDKYKLLHDYATTYAERNKLAFLADKKKTERNNLQSELTKDSFEEIKNQISELESEAQNLQNQVDDMDNVLSTIHSQISEEDKKENLENIYPQTIETEKETMDMIDDWTEYVNTVTHPEYIKVPETLRESGPEIAEFENLISLFESKHSLAELHAITDLDAKEADAHPVRYPAKTELAVIRTKIDILKKETNISSEKYDELYAKYKKLSYAVGVISGGKVDHTR